MSEVQQPEVRSRRNAIVGALFMVIAAAFAWEATNYEPGTALRMGPGFIPMTLAAILAILGLAILVPGLRSQERVQVPPIPWRGMLLVLGPIVLFGELSQILGLVPVVFVCTFATALASTRNSAPAAAAIGAALAALCWLVFKVGLGITLPTFGSLFAF